ncbi:MAG: ABC transporter ATP-binding protein [Bacteroidales bacterium]|nr:ABC transporter ATP-binding protein [Bacteroidales bacterium]
MELNIFNLKCGYKIRKKTFIIPSYTLNISVKSSQLIALIGNNGIGKTTFLKTIAGLQKPIDGEIEYNKIILNNLTGSEVSKYVSYLPAVNHKVPYIKVVDFVKFGLYKQKNKKEKEENIKHILEELNIIHKSYDYVHQLSDGEYQLVNIARIFIRDNPVVLLDEVCSHLDKENRELIYKFLLKKASEDKIIIFSSHFYDETFPYVHKIIIFENNKYQFVLPEELYLTTDHLICNNLLRKMNFTKIPIIGDGIPYLCTCSAIAKYNFNFDSGFKIIILQNNKKVLWVIKKDNKFVERFDSLETLINYLKNKNL